MSTWNRRTFASGSTDPTISRSGCQEFCAQGHDDGKERIIAWLSRRNFWTNCLPAAIRMRCLQRRLLDDLKKALHAFYAVMGREIKHSRRIVVFPHQCHRAFDCFCHSDRLAMRSASAMGCVVVAGEYPTLVRSCADRTRCRRNNRRESASATRSATDPSGRSGLKFKPSIECCGSMPARLVD